MLYNIAGNNGAVKMWVPLNKLLNASRYFPHCKDEPLTSMIISCDPLICCDNFHVFAFSRGLIAAYSLDLREERFGLGNIAIHPGMGVGSQPVLHVYLTMGEGDDELGQL